MRDSLNQITSQYIFTEAKVKQLSINVVQLIYVADATDVFVCTSEASFDVANTCKRTAKSCSKAASQIGIHEAYADVIYLPEIAGTTFRLMNLQQVAICVKVRLQ